MNFYFKLIIFLFLSINTNASNIIFEGLSKLTKSDIQALTDIDVNKSDYNLDEIDQIINDLYNSKIISNVKYELNNDTHFIEISETPIIQDIFINGNVNISDENLLSLISSNPLSLFDKDKVMNDISLIRNVYTSKGYNNMNVEVKTEKFNDRVNLIYTINEGYLFSIRKISFLGNNNYSDNFLYSLISLKNKNFYNIFSSGSNFTNESFNFDKNKIIKFYESKGFFDVNVSYELFKTTFNQYNLIFFIKEGKRIKINNIEYSFKNNLDQKLFSSEKKIFSKKVIKNDNYFDSEIINDHLINLNDKLYSSNLVNHSFTYDFVFDGNNYDLIISEIKSSPQTINNIIINGNSITKDSTLRSKLSIEPGDFLNEFKLNKSKNDISKLKYVNKVKVTKSHTNSLTDIEFTIDENTKTGNFLLGGSFSGDTGFGVGLGLKDYNVLGTGNEIDLSINANSEKSLFSIDYSQYNLFNSNLINTYGIFNQESDLSSSFGFKTRNQGISYGISYNVDEELSLALSIKYEMIEGYSPSNNNSYITDNINDFDQIVLSLNINKNSTNNYLYPTDGQDNRFSLKLSPETLSDDSYYRALFSNKIYKQFKQSDNFIFISNNLGIADSFGENLKTINAFSLGGLNFKGFEYRGVGPIDNNVYLGGNKYFTTTLGYGSSFLFDDKDNVNIKLFTTLGSIWDSDYSSNNDFELRSSAGLSFDLITAVGPISFSYAIPIQKQNNDKVREFNFSIGTSF